MKLSPATIDVLKNFSTINQSILFKPGNVIRTISQQKNIFAEASVVEDFPIECAIYELPRFLSALSLFDEPELNFNEQYVDITAKASSNNIRYYYANASLIVAPPSKSLEIDEEVDKFTLDQETLSKLGKAASHLSVPDFVIDRNDKTRTIKTTNVKNKSSNVFTVTQPVKKGSPYTVVLSNDNLKYIPGNYEIVVGKLKNVNIVSFSSGVVKYWIATEA
jgi:hypothetical protein